MIDRSTERISPFSTFHERQGISCLLSLLLVVDFCLVQGRDFVGCHYPNLLNGKSIRLFVVDSILYFGYWRLSLT